MNRQCAKLTSVSVARAYVQRADGRREVHYSVEAVPIRQLRRWFRLRRHLAFMKKEDRTWLSPPSAGNG